LKKKERRQTTIEKKTRRKENVSLRDRITEKHIYIEKGKKSNILYNR